MRNLKTLFRKTPAHFLKAYFEYREAKFPEDFDWTLPESDLAKAIDKAISVLAIDDRDALRAELQVIQELTETNGWYAIERFSNKEGFEVPQEGGPEGAAFFIVVNYDDNIFERIIASASLQRYSGGQKWSCFHVKSGKFSEQRLKDEDSKNRFISGILKAIDFDKNRDHDPDWFEVPVEGKLTGEETTQTYLTLYLQERAKNDLAFKNKKVVRTARAGVTEIIFAMNPKLQEIEIAAKGGLKVREPLAKAFCASFLGDGVEPVQVTKRAVNFDVLKQKPEFETFPDDRIESVSVVKMAFIDNYLRSEFQYPSDNSQIYDLVNGNHGDSSPLRTGAGLRSATIKIKRSKGEGKMLTVDLRFPNSTTLLNQTEDDKKVSMKLLERWKILPSSMKAGGDQPLIEAAE